MKQFKCPYCGGPLTKKNDELFCPYCRYSFQEEDTDGISKLDDVMQEVMGNALRELCDAAHEDYISSTKVGSCAKKVKELATDESSMQYFIASFYEAAVHKNKIKLNDFLNKIDLKQKQHSMFLDEIIKFVIKGLAHKNVQTLKALVQRAYDEGVMFRGDYTNYMTQIDSIVKEKFDAGDYDLGIERDVFVAYSSKDIAIVNEIVDFLEKDREIKCFTAIRNLQHGVGAIENYWNSLKRAMRRCKVVVFISTQNSRTTECEAVGSTYEQDGELPFIRDNLPQMKRIEYRPPRDNGKTTMGAKDILDSFFAGLEPCSTKEDLYRRVMAYKSNKATTPIATYIDSPKQEIKNTMTINSEELNGMKCNNCGGNLFTETEDDDRLCCAYCKHIMPDPRKLLIQESENAVEENDIDGCYNKGKEFLDNEDYAEAVRLFMIAATHGHAAAQNELGFCYENGYGVPEDINEAVKWYRSAAELGNSVAQYNLGASYENGEGVSVDINEALKWYKKAAEQGDEDAMEAIKRIEKQLLEEKPEQPVVQPEQPTVLKCPACNIENEPGTVFCRRCGYNLYKDYKDKNTTIQNYDRQAFDIVDTELKKYNGNGGSVQIPYGVTEIDDFAFFDCNNLTSISIPDSVTNIGNRAFCNCKALEKVDMPDTIVTIGEGAFHSCESLKNIKISNKAVSIGDYAFCGCYSLSAIEIPNSVISIGEYAFLTDGSMESITVQSGNKKYRSANNCLVEIESKTLILGCKNSVIPADGSVTTIGGGAFLNCTGLTDITIPDDVSTIEYGAFSGCSGLHTIYCYASHKPEKWHDGWLLNCDADIIWKGIYRGVDQYARDIESYIQPVSDRELSEKEQVKQDITLPYPTLDNYSKQEFTITETYLNKYKSSSQFVKIPYGVTRICNHAFSDCTNLTSITIPKTVTSIGEAAFSGCTRLMSITIPKTVNYIDSGVFEGCASLMNINVEAGNKTYHDNGNCVIDTKNKVLIAGCNNSVIPNDNSIVSIGKSAFSMCEGLMNIAIPISVKYIEDSAFYRCSSLTNIKIPNSLISIGCYAFAYCSSLTDITMPNSVTTIRMSAFSGCSSLTDISIPPLVKTIESDVFAWCSKLKNIKIHSNVTSIEMGAFTRCEALTNIEIPISVTSIDRNVFENCDNLLLIFYNGTKQQWKTISKSRGWNTGMLLSCRVKLKDGTIIKP